MKQKILHGVNMFANYTAKSSIDRVRYHQNGIIIARYPKLNEVGVTVGQRASITIFKYDLLGKQDADGYISLKHHADLLDKIACIMK